LISQITERDSGWQLISNNFSNLITCLFKTLANHQFPRPIRAKEALKSLTKKSVKFDENKEIYYSE